MATDKPSCSIIHCRLVKTAPTEVVTIGPAIGAITGMEFRIDYRVSGHSDVLGELPGKSGKSTLRERGGEGKDLTSGMYPAVGPAGSKKPCLPGVGEDFCPPASVNKFPFHCPLICLDL